MVDSSGQMHAHESIRRAICAGDTDSVKFRGEQVERINDEPFRNTHLMAAVQTQNLKPAIVAYLLFGRGSDPADPTERSRGRLPAEEARALMKLSRSRPERARALETVACMLEYAAQARTHRVVLPRDPPEVVVAMHCPEPVQPELQRDSCAMTFLSRVLGAIFPHRPAAAQVEAPPANELRAQNDVVWDRLHAMGHRL